MSVVSFVIIRNYYRLVLVVEGLFMNVDAFLL